MHPFADLLWQLRDLVQHRGTVPVQIYAESKGAWQFINIILVGGIPTTLKKMSQLGLLSPIYGKIKDIIPNHQPDYKS